MARLLVATVPLTGHVQPMLLVVQELIARGHTVRWYAGGKFAPAIERAGAVHVPMHPSIDWDDADADAALPALRGKRGLARVKAQLEAMFIGPMVRQLRDLEAAAGAFAPDAVLADQAHLGAALLHEARGVPWAGLGISALMIPSIDTAPFGSAQPPARDERDRARTRRLTWLVQRVLFWDITRSYHRGRVAAGLAAGTGTYFDVLSPQLYLQPTIPAFEYPRSDLPPQVHFIGPLVPEAPPERAALPAWWDELAAAHRRGRPIILVTQGTLATDPRELLRPALRALAGEDALVVAIAGRGDDPASLGLSVLPANVRIARYVPYHALMPLVSVVVTNGGYGGVQMALRHGVPLVVAGGSEDKPEIAARVAWAGAGIDLRTGWPFAREVRRAVRRVQEDPTFRARVRELAREMAAHDAPALAADLVERLVAERRPVLRAAPAGAVVAPAWAHEARPTGAGAVRRSPGAP